jgi:hypothetical protein
MFVIIPYLFTKLCYILVLILHISYTLHTSLYRFIDIEKTGMICYFISLKRGMVLMRAFKTFNVAGFNSEDSCIVINNKRSIWLPMMTFPQ